MKALLPILILAACSTTPRAVTDPIREFDQGHDTVVIGSASGSNTTVPGDERDVPGLIQKSVAPDTSKAIANYVSVQRVDDEFVYLDGRRLRMRPVVPDQPTSEKLGFALQKGRDREAMMMRMRVACSGGFEVCFGGAVYLFYEEKDHQGHCFGSWYVTEASCK